MMFEYSIFEIYQRECYIPNRGDIDERPKIVASKERFGDWEADTIIGKDHQGAILTLAERRSKLTLIYKLKAKTAIEVERAMEYLLKPLAPLVHTITMDNGKEFANHQHIANSLLSHMQRGKKDSSNIIMG